MAFDFTSVVERRGTACVKWDAPNGAGIPAGEVIPMWVADMDFRTAPCIIDALRKRVEHGVFGYTEVPESYYDAVISWFQRRRGWTIERDWILYTTAVVPALSVCIKAFTEPGDQVVFLTPAYNCFFSSIRNAGCVASASPIRYHYPSDGASMNVITVDIDWEDLERRCSDPSAKILLVCNPHNPVGRIWTRDELARMGEIARRHGLIVLSDEIHCELEMPGHTFTPFAAISPENQDCCVTLNSPSKSFNTAGLQIANIITNKAEWRRRIDRVINIYEVCDVNPFGVAGLIAAYTEGEPWLKELNAALWENYLDLRDLFAREVPECPVTDLQGTYLVWMDVSVLTRPAGAALDEHIPKFSCEERAASAGQPGKRAPMTSQEIVDSLIAHEHVRLGPGEIYGDGYFLRINIASPHSICHEGLVRIARGLRRLISSRNPA
ncbi:MAG: PatB family C-S lyase [Bacteroidales bacterium]|nr:PatB family C-S lyase [Bacteroidales bacterium]